MRTASPCAAGTCAARASCSEPDTKRNASPSTCYRNVALARRPLRYEGAPTGAVSFDVAAGTTTTAVVRLDCRLPSTGKGKVQVSGSANVCPRIDAFSVTPSEVLVGGSMALSVEVTDSDALPAA